MATDTLPRRGVEVADLIASIEAEGVDESRAATDVRSLGNTLSSVPAMASILAAQNACGAALQAQEIFAKSVNASLIASISKWTQPSIVAYAIASTSHAAIAAGQQASFATLAKAAFSITGATRRAIEVVAIEQASFFEGLQADLNFSTLEPFYWLDIDRARGGDVTALENLARAIADKWAIFPGSRGREGRGTWIRHALRARASNQGCSFKEAMVWSIFGVLPMVLAEAMEPQDYRPFGRARLWRSKQERYIIPYVDLRGISPRRDPRYSNDRWLRAKAIARAEDDLLHEAPDPQARVWYADRIPGPLRRPGPTNALIGKPPPLWQRLSEPEVLDMLDAMVRTPVQRQILGDMREKLSPREIAERRAVSRDTVKETQERWHKRLMRKFQTNQI